MLKFENHQQADSDGAYGVMAGNCITASLRAARIKLAAERMATPIQKVLNFDSSAYMLGWGVATYDGQYAIQSLVRTRTSGAAGNFNFATISDASIDELTDAIKSETDIAERNALIHEALVRTRVGFAYVPLHHQMRPWAMEPGVTTVRCSDDRPEARFAALK